MLFRYIRNVFSEWILILLPRLLGMIIELHILMLLWFVETPNSQIVSDVPLQSHSGDHVPYLYTFSRPDFKKHFIRLDWLMVRSQPR